MWKALSGGASDLTDRVLSAVRHLVREDGPFVSALAQARDTPCALALALETIDGDMGTSSLPEAGAVSRLEMLLRARLLDGVRRGDVPDGLEIADLSIFYANVVVSLVVEALSGGDVQRLSTIRRVAMKVLTQVPAVSA